MWHPTNTPHSVMGYLNLGAKRPDADSSVYICKAGLPFLRKIPPKKNGGNGGYSKTAFN